MKGIFKGLKKCMIKLDSNKPQWFYFLLRTRFRQTNTTPERKLKDKWYATCRCSGPKFRATRETSMIGPNTLSH